MFVSGTLSSSPIDVARAPRWPHSCRLIVALFFSSKTVVTMSLFVKNEEKSKDVFLLTKIIVGGGLALFNDH